MALVSATSAQFATFLTNRNYTVAEAHAPLLVRSYDLLSMLPFCDVDTVDADRVADAQCHMAYSMSQEGGGFNPAAIAEAKTLTKESLGRGAIVEEWEVNEKLSGTDPLSQLRSMPVAYGLLKNYMCGTGGGGFVV